MRYLFSFLCFVCLGLGTLFAQPTISYGLELYPNLSNRRQAIYFDIDPSLVDSLDRLETGMFGYGVGLFWSYRGEKIGIQAGANYSQAGYKRVRSLLDDGSPDKPDFIEFSQTFRTQQIEVPIAVNFYQELGSDDEFYFMFGAVLSYQLQNKLTTQLFGNNSSEERKESPAPGDYRKFNMGFQAGIGWEHHFSEGFTMALQPTFRFYFQGLVKPDPALLVNRNLYSLGLRLSFRLDQQFEYVE